MGKIYVVGLGPGDEENMTNAAVSALKSSDVIVGYKTYTGLIKGMYPQKEIIESSMRQEMERCSICAGLAKQGKTVALVCSGDAGVYGMAPLLLETAQKEGVFDVEIIPGVTAALSGSAALGAPLGHDFCTISLSDLLTPWEVIEKRLIHAASGDFVIALYNPASHGRPDHLKKAVDVLLTVISPDRPCGYVRNIARDHQEKAVCTLCELKNIQADMFTTVFVGNSSTYISGGRLITPRGYRQ